MARWDKAAWHPVTTCGPGTIQPIAVTLHHQVGYGDPASVYESRNVSAHFWIPRSGSPVQHVDTNIRAWHGGTDAHNSNGIGVETEGCASDPYSDPLTENQLDWFAALMRWAEQTHGIPLQLSEQAWTPGLNYHRCAGGYNTACPCQTRVDARTEILRRATGVPPGTTPTPTPPTPVEVEMFLAYATADSNDRTVREGYQYVVRDNDIVYISTAEDSKTLQAKLGDMIPLHGNQIAAFK